MMNLEVSGTAIEAEFLEPKRKTTQEQFVYKKLSLKPAILRKKKKSKKLRVRKDNLDASEFGDDQSTAFGRGETLTLTLMKPKKQQALSQRCSSSLDL